jgi:hypothetical protein
MTADRGDGEVVDSLAVVAVGLAGMGTGSEEALATLADLLLKLGVTDPEVLDAAAEAVAALPQPVDETPEERERHAAARELLGVPSAEEELAASLQAREWLQHVAALLRGGA